MRTTAVVLLCLYAVSVLGDEPMQPPSCFDGSIRRPCSPFGCPRGYQCINGQCCRGLPISECSFGEIGSPCPRFGPCRPGYECKRGLCCRTAPSCSSGVVGPACSVLSPCRPGNVCRGGRCCTVCPSGRKEGGRCNLTPGATRCRSGYDCINNLCCASISCSSGVVGPSCSVLNPCTPGHACRNGRCCAVCPSGRTEGGRCNLTPGATRCRSGYDCINNLCCASISCSSGVIGPACSVLSPCRPGNVCRGGQCCAVCPIGRREGGRCNLTPGATRCPFGYDCINNLCCTSRTPGGVCPRPIEDRNPFCRFGPRFFRCRSDDDCRGGEKCCPDGCGRRRCTIARRG